MLYLSRYVKGGPISERRLLSSDDKTTCFGYTDHTDGKPKVMRLSTDQFLQRVLWHVPVAGQHTIRQYGLYAHQARSKRAQCRAQLGQDDEQTQIGALEWPLFLKQFGQADASTCPDCGKSLVRGPTLARRRTENSIYKVRGGGTVQQDVRPNAPGATKGVGPPGLNAVAGFFFDARASVN